MKKCNKCGEKFPATKEYFYPAKTTLDGFKGTCKECEKKTSKEWYKNNKDSHSKKSVERYRSLSEEEKKKANKRGGTEKRRTSQRAYYAANNLRVLEVKRLWRDNNREAFREIRRRQAQRRRAAKKVLEKSFNQMQWNQCKLIFNSCCAYCGKREKLEQEHFIPVVKNGEYTLNNIVPACRSCNSKKNDKDFFEWYPGFEFYCPKREKAILKYLNYENKMQQMSIL